MPFLRDTAGQVKVVWKVLILTVALLLTCACLFCFVDHFLISEIQYQIAVGFLEDGDDAQAIQCFTFLGDYSDSETQILEIGYKQAVGLYDRGLQREAAAKFKQLGNYKDSRKRASDILLALQDGGLSGVQVGDTLYFGHYEQDNNLTNGEEEIEWIVLAVEDGKALCLSKYGLDAKPYHQSPDDVVWENCTLRTWLNETFYQSAFLAEQQARIALMATPGHVNPEFDTPTGMDSEDRIFLLSLKEVELYLASNIAASCTATAYAVDNGAMYASNQLECWWWVRTPGCKSSYAAGVNPLGVISTAGNRVDYNYGAVRPAMWITL